MGNAIGGANTRTHRTALTKLVKACSVANNHCRQCTHEARCLAVWDGLIVGDWYGMSKDTYLRAARALLPVLRIDILEKRPDLRQHLQYNHEAYEMLRACSAANNYCDNCSAKKECAESAKKVRQCNLTERGLITMYRKLDSVLRIDLQRLRPDLAPYLQYNLGRMKRYIKISENSQRGKTQRAPA